MSDKPDALRLADMLCRHWHPTMKAAAVKLRVQHAEIESAHQAQRDAENELSRALARHAMAESAFKADRNALLEALQDLCDTLGECGMTEKARAAIAKATGETT